ncbi:MAG TPA: PQQ-binding-like beta-propeller repeat protein, partial [Armatimonadota bacterium]|nr:PQQ-binding-like beta-propeller repeat protein [Armatimonadota bacterium]
MKTARIVLLLILSIQVAAYSQLANTAWPMFRHDLRHTALSPYHDPTSTNALKINVNGGSILSSCAIGTGGVVYVGAGSYLYSISSSGGINWSYPIGSTRSSPAIATDGTIYVGSNDYKLYAINPNGTKKWSYSTGGVVSGSPAVASDGTVYIGSRSGILYALNPNGSKKWQRTLSNMHMTSPAVGPDGTIYVGGGSLYAINPNNTEKWHYSPGTSILTSPAVNSDGTRVYFGCGDGNLYCLNSSDGSVAWFYPVCYKAGSTPSSPAIGPDGSILVGSNWGTFYCIAPDGTETWRYETRSDVRSSPAVNADGTVFFGTMDGFLYALNSNGTLKWRYLTKGSIFSSPAIDAEGDAWIPSWDGYVYGNLNHTPAAATPPSGLTATLVSDSDVRLDWADNSSDEYGFSIYRKQPGQEYALLDSVGAGVTTYTDPGLASGTTFYYQVAAYQEGGFSYSNEVSIKTPGLEVPTDCAAVQVPGVGISLSWSDNATQELGYKIERKAGNLALFREIATVGENGMSFTDPSVNPATDYYYRIRAFNMSGHSSYSNEAWCASEGRNFDEISTVSTTRPQIALTFDAGTESVKYSILDTLRQYNVRSTFFVTGLIAQATPDFWVQATLDGHEVCNHTWDHPDLRYISDDQIRWEFAAAEEMIYGITGNHCRPLFRAPYGARNSHVLQIAAEEGYRHVFWTADTGDAGWLAPTQEIIDRALAAAQNGAIILFHCTLDTTATAIQTIVPTLLSQGYELVTVPELDAPLQITSPTEAIFGNRSLMSVPIEPAHPAPLQVFRGAPIDGYLIQWDNESQSSVAYDAFDPVGFGGISPDYGMWITSSTSLGPVKVCGSTQTTARHIMLPHAYLASAGWTIIGYPFQTAQQWSNCFIYNPNATPPQTRSIADARDAGWISSVL